VVPDDYVVIYYTSRNDKRKTCACYFVTVIG